MDQSFENNVCIFCFYSADGEVDRGALILLAEIRKISSYLVMIVNGEYCYNSDCERLADRIIERENSGYDACAYKTALADEDIRCRVRRSKRLILCNNTFWGPFIGIEEICRKTEASNCDFYGITRIGVNLIECIQSYFIVITEEILRDDRFWFYFDEILPSDCDYDTVLRVFEIGLYKYLCDLGYVPGAFIDSISCNLYTNPNGSIVIDRVPLLKKKAFSPNIYNREKALMALKSVSDMYEYDIKIVVDYVHSVYGILIDEDDILTCQDTQPESDVKQLFDVTRDYVLQFIRLHSRVYIYGAGGMAKKLFKQVFCFECNRELEGFLVSDNIPIEYPRLYGHPIIHLSDSDDSVGVIVALNKENTIDVRESLRDRDCLYLWK